MKQKTEFQLFLEEEINKVKGIYYPVKAGFLRRLLIRKTAIGNLHPNPYDEFCDLEIGPNSEIISRYKEDYFVIKDCSSNAFFMKSGATEALMVEKTRPDGYMILNGHHRWAAALRVGMKQLPIRIVDLTQASDIRKMLKTTSFSKRVTLDLDEVVFCPETDPYIEKPRPFPVNRIYRERLRLGIPALFHMLNGEGYDIWIYTASYYSLEYLKYYFMHYHVRVTGIVTGTARRAAAGSGAGEELEKLASKKYRTTIHIDDQMILRTFNDSQDFEEYPLSGSPATWSREAMDIIREMKPHE